MTYLYLLLSLLAVDLLAAVSPGPNFFVVTQAAFVRTRRHAAAVVLGIMTANLIWCAAVAFGPSALFELAPRLYGAIKLLGGAYLIYLGVRLPARHSLGVLRRGARRARTTASGLRAGGALAYNEGANFDPLDPLNSPDGEVFIRPAERARHTRH